MYKQTIKQSAVEASRYLRQRQTKAEEIFWQKVRNKQFYNLKFLRQHPLYFQFDNRKRFVIVDFYCHELKIVIELDGTIHKSQRVHDRERSWILKQLGMRVIRIQNEAVFKNVNGVLDRLCEMVCPR
ncbi:MAG TPA: hypothetical protein DEB09_05340 [Candidatus Magasanikbacteria bacterium]|nr:hypothetical protein [Candidatus Magasanikbacteria bacterium]